MDAGRSSFSGRMLDTEMECSACNWTDPNLAGMYFGNTEVPFFFLVPLLAISAFASRGASKEAGCRFDLRSFQT